MEINRNNYEAFLLDLLEGRLTVGQKEELRVFLQRNPDCPASDPDLQVLKYEAGEIRYPSRELLKRKIPMNPLQIHPSDFDLLSIARMEAELTSEQLACHDTLIQNDPEKKKEWELWRKARLTPSAINFPNRERIKKRVGILRHLEPSRRYDRGKSHFPVPGRVGMISAAAAAAFILLFILIRPGEFLFYQEASEEPVGGIVTGSDLRMSEKPGAEIPEQDQSVEATEQGQSRLAEGSRLTEGSRLAEGSRLTEGSRTTEGSTLTENSVPAKEAVYPNKQLISRETLVSGESSRPGTLSIIKKQDPPELTGAPGRLRVAELVSQPAPIPGKEIYDRIKPLSITSSRTNRSGISLARIAELNVEEVFENITGKQEISFWNIANSGIEGINRITGSEMSLFANRDADGELSEIEFKSRIFSFSRSLDRE